MNVLKMDFSVVCNTAKAQNERESYEENIHHI